MSIKRLQRYDIDEDGDLVSDSAYGYYCLTKDVTELEATNAELYNMLEHLVEQDCISDSSLHREVIVLLASAKGE
ncbi:MAG: hypothetical protein JKY50_00760 [Oleispira sp.]|nr:hypothetical protein [Oleispira sp.]